MSTKAQAPKGGRLSAMRTGGLIVVVPSIFREATLSTIEASAGRTQAPHKEVLNVRNT
jgi:hypothetical protein